MDAQSHLISQGWSGPGTSLDPTGRGLTHPLLVSKKTSNTGIGLTGWNAHVGGGAWWDSLWERGANSKPKEDGTASGEDVGMGKGKLWGLKRGGGVGLYGRFRRGEGLGGTIGMVVPEGAEGKGGDDAKEQRRKERRMRKAEKQEKRLKMELAHHGHVRHVPSSSTSDDEVATSKRRRISGHDATETHTTMTMHAIFDDEIPQLPTPEADSSEEREQAKRRRKALRQEKRESKAARRAARTEAEEVVGGDGYTEKMEDEGEPLEALVERGLDVKEEASAEKRRRKGERKEQRARKEERRRRRGPESNVD